VLIMAALTLNSPFAVLVLLGSFGFARGLTTLPVSLEHLQIGETALLIGVAAVFLA
jgi:hypothetical protein